ncbi:hypothetical protein ACFSKM_16395 [Ancylobacter dichloromethanicus]
MNAVAHHTHYGYSNHGRVQDHSSEIANPELTMCVEIIGHRPDLESFVRRHGALLHDKVIIFKHLEHWSIDQEGDSLVEETTLGEPLLKKRKNAASGDAGLRYMEVLPGNTSILTFCFSA